MSIRLRGVKLPAGLNHHSNALTSYIQALRNNSERSEEKKELKL